MGAVGLYDGFNDPLLYMLHSIKFSVQDLARFLWVDGLKVIVLSLYIHHNGGGVLGVTPFLGGDFMGTGNHKIPSDS